MYKESNKCNLLRDGRNSHDLYNIQTHLHKLLSRQMESLGVKKTESHAQRSIKQFTIKYNFVNLFYIL